MFYPLTILNPKIRRDDLIQYLENNGIETRYLLPLINQPIYREIFGNLDDQFPVAARLNNTAFYIGCHPDLTDGDMDYVVKHFRRFFGSRV
jgi:dTDP-4-amino-4,6-dideoxygalactose transaminase